MASKRRIRRKSCGTKERFTDSVAAQRRISELKRKTGDRAWINVYPCQFCKGYHIGHAPGSNRVFMRR